MDEVRAKELLQKVAAGDEYAFAQLFDLYRPNIYSTALRLTGEVFIAEEIAQDAFLKVWLNRLTLPDIVNFDGWLYTIAKNLTFNAIKGLQQEKKKRLEMVQESLTAHYPQTDHLVQEKQFNAILEQAIARLPPKQKQTYLLIKKQEMKREEVAAELQVSAETVKWNLEQAMKSIRAFCLVHLDEVPRIFMLYYFTKYF
ncbi:RNA polymerase sigma factor [Pedobacter sp. MC2016-14]|uniref:RNA polymerase sigma factor n=1 Tax=Pedobacter sp. MC2016-14 TaxID=2897327 RepID=UPI001E58088F|nr:RNA polymerase sigma factor [Pedobacter sp. MC2016-14]MCD0486833.1 RNA polymerase sigma factor [Pedobacter sp. MC2016-14]